MEEQVYQDSHVHVSRLSGGMRTIPRAIYATRARRALLALLSQMPVVLADADTAHAHHVCGGVQPRRAHMHGRV